MKLTPFGKLFIALVAVGVIGFVAFKKYGDDISGKLREWSGAAKKDPDGTKKPDGSGDVTKDDFANVNQGISDAPREGGLKVTGGVTPGTQMLNRPLKVGINTWAGHAPGIVANGGMKVGGVSSLYKKKYGLDVEFILLEDPSAKLAAFIKGDIDRSEERRVGKECA